MKDIEADVEPGTAIRYGWWNDVYQIKVELMGTEPAIWRRLLLPAGVKLPWLHDVLQVAMGWTNSHLHEFLVGELHFGQPGDDFNVPPIDYAAIELIQVAPRVGSTVRYLYDFGDRWEHLITVEDALRPESIVEPLPRCLDGARACPPEDVGGTHRYDEFLTALANPYHAEHKQWRRWAGPRFDPAAFDLDGLNRRLAPIAPRRPRDAASPSRRREN